MKTVKVIIPNDKIDFFTELMDRLGIHAEVENEIGNRSSMPSQSKPAINEQRSSLRDVRKKMSLPQSDSSIKDVLKKIEQMRGRS